MRERQWVFKESARCWLYSCGKWCAWLGCWRCSTSSRRADIWSVAEVEQPDGTRVCMFLTQMKCLLFKKTQRIHALNILVTLTISFGFNSALPHWMIKEDSIYSHLARYFPMEHHSRCFSNEYAINPRLGCNYNQWIWIKGVTSQSWFVTGNWSLSELIDSCECICMWLSTCMHGCEW